MAKFRPIIDAAACPACGAKEGEYCKTSKGKTFYNTVHAERAKAAGRMDLLQPDSDEKQAPAKKDVAETKKTENAKPEAKLKVKAKPKQKVAVKAKKATAGETTWNLPETVNVVVTATVSIPVTMPLDTASKRNLKELRALIKDQHGIEMDEVHSVAG